MKKILLNMLAVPALLLGVSSCELFRLDNFDGPNASLSGSIIDAETGELVQSDIIEGTTIKLLELGEYRGRSTAQYLRVKTDGTYANTMLFENWYRVEPDSRNFTQVEMPDSVKIGKNTVLDFHVTPYLRVKNVNLTKEANTVYATFQLESPADVEVKTIALFCSDQPSVGNPIRLVAKEINLNAPVDPNKMYRVGINCAQNSALIKENRDYYFRVGALAAIGGAKYNYAPAVKMNSGSIVDEPTPDYYYFDHCESTDTWNGATAMSIDTTNPTEGDGCIRTDFNGGVVIFQKIDKDHPFNTHVSKETGHFAFDLFISDVNSGDWAAGDANIEITSGGTCDQQELAWQFRKASLGLHNGWNYLDFKLSTGNPTGGAINLEAVNYMRIYHTALPGGITFKIDNIRFYEPLADN